MSKQKIVAEYHYLDDGKDKLPMPMKSFLWWITIGETQYAIFRVLRWGSRLLERGALRMARRISGEPHV